MDVIERIQEYLKTKPVSARDSFDVLPAGLLFGTVQSTGNPEITDFRTGRLTADEVSAVLRKYDGVSHHPIGYFRVSTDEQLHLTDEDLLLVRTSFCDPSSVFLLIQPFSSGPPKAGFFFWDQGQVSGDFCFLEFPFDARSLEAAADDSSASDLASREHVSLSAQKNSRPSIRPQVKPGSRAYQLSASAGGRTLQSENTGELKRDRRKVAPLLLGAMVVVAVFLAGVPRIRLAFDRPSAVTASVNVPRQVVTSAGLGLSAQDRDDGLLVSWTRTAGKMQLAQRAVLEIRDGDRFRELGLDKDQIGEGSVLYLPKSDDVSFRLQVYFDSRTESESVRVLGGPVHRVPAANAAPGRVFTAAERSKDGRRSREVSNGKPNVDSPINGDAPPDGAAALQSRIGSSKEQSVGSSQSSMTSPPPDLPDSNSAKALQERAEAIGALLPVAGEGVAATRRANPSTLTGAPRGVEGAKTSHSSYVSPTPIRRMMPLRSMLAPSTFSRPETVAVRLQVDEKGHVTDVRAAPEVPHQSRFLLPAVIDAAKQWTFRPAQLNGKTVPSEQTLIFHFGSPSE